MHGPVIVKIFCALVCKDIILLLWKVRSVNIVECFIM
jgi:hypothetical protein